jgi:serine/threonine-protein kinase
MMGASYIDGRLLFMNESTLMVQPFDAGNLKMSGSPVPVVERVGNIQGAVGLFSASSSDVLVYRTGAAAEYQATWFDRQGKVAGTFGKPGSDQGFTLSPDAKHALVRDARQLQSGDLWRLDFESGVRSRVTIRQSLGSFAVWSPDGNSIIFAAGNTMDTLFRKASSGAGEEKELFKKTGEIKYPTSWSRDARWLLYSTPATLKSGSDVWLLPLEGDRKPVLLLGDPFDESVGSFSPDMRWIAYGSNESGRPEIFVRPFKSSGPSGPALGEGKSQISKDGGYLPAWSAEGKEIIFHGPNGAPMAVNVNGNGAEFQHENLRQLFNAPANVGDWDVTADGKRFLMAVPLQKEAGDDAITVVLNWQAALKH